MPCGGLSWLHFSFLLHVKYTISYRNIVSSVMNVILDMYKVGLVVKDRRVGGNSSRPISLNNAGRRL